MLLTQWSKTRANLLSRTGRCFQAAKYRPLSQQEGPATIDRLCAPARPWKASGGATEGTLRFTFEEIQQHRDVERCLGTGRHFGHHENE
jgi:hypothetical protein